MKALLATITAVVIVFLGATVRADKCTAAKVKAIGKKETRLLGCYAKVAAKNDPGLLPPCIQKVEGKYAAAFAKAGACSGDQMVCECIAEDCVDAVRADLPDAGKCE